MFTIIAAVGKNRELGKGGGLVWRIPEDMRFFREKTMGHKIIMGRRTAEGLPKKGLPGREVVVLTRAAEGLSFSDTRPLGPSPRASGAPARAAALRQVPEKDKTFATLVQDYQDSPEEVFIGGGATMYRQFLPYVKKMYLTEIEAEDEEADVFFPEFPAAEFSRKVIGRGKVDNYGGGGDDLSYAFVEYTRK